MRKRLYEKAALAAACALTAAGLALAPVGASRAQPSPIAHIVVLDLENHTFDNLLGFWCQQNTLRCQNAGGNFTGMPSQVTLSNGAKVTPSADPDVAPNVDHSMTSQLAAMNIVHGVPQMNGWQNQRSGCAAPAYKCVSGYQPSQVPNITGLASAFAISDAFFSFKDSPSWGGHMYAVAGTTDGFTGDNPVAAQGVTAQPGWGCDSDKVARWGAGGPYQPSCVPDFALGLPNGGAFEPTKALYVPTIMDRLDAAGLSWRIYGAAQPTVNGIPANGYIWSVCPTFAECLDTSQHSGLVDSGQFLTDAAAGTLPAFSLITAGGSNLAGNCHNGFSMTACDDYVGQVAQAVMSSPDWPSTVLFITWDDYGGFYDSVPPPVNPDSTQEGPRLPLIAVSPFAIPQSTDDTPASFASILAFTEHNFGLAPLEENDASAYDLSGMFAPGELPGSRGLPVRHLRSRPHMVTRPVPKGDHIDWSQADEDT